MEGGEKENHIRSAGGGGRERDVVLCSCCVCERKLGRRKRDICGTYGVKRLASIDKIVALKQLDLQDGGSTC